MTSVLDIYEQAVTSFDDPIITRLYKTSDIDFNDKMFGFLKKAIPLFISPVNAIKDLETLVEPKLVEQNYTGDGRTVSFNVAVFKNEEYFIEGLVNNQKREGNFDEINEVFIFNTAPEEGADILIRVYQPGYFSKTLDMHEINILSALTVSCWSEKEENFLLDIRRLLMTSNFKLHDSSNVLRGKVNWHYTMREKASKMMNAYSLLRAQQRR